MDLMEDGHLFFMNLVWNFLKIVLNSIIFKSLKGIAGLIWCVIWFFLAASSPDKHKFISEEEKNYIMNNIQETNVNTVKLLFLFYLQNLNIIK